MSEWKNITKEKLKKLYYEENQSDQEIAELYGVTRTTVSRRRKSYGISHAIQLFRRMEQQNPELLEQLNQDSYGRLKNVDTDSIAKALTHYVFRNGPVEDIHADGKLSQNDMMVLNKFMVNRLAGFFDLLEKGEWLQLELLYSYYRTSGSDWDKADPDTQEVQIMIESFLNGNSVLYDLWLNEQDG